MYLDTEVVGFMNADVYKDGGIFNLLPRWSVQVDMTIACHQPRSISSNDTNGLLTMIYPKVVLHTYYEFNLKINFSSG